MTIHKKLENGAAKCGANVYRHWDTGEKVISHSRRLHFEQEGLPANCRRCLNTVHRPTVAEFNEEELKGKVFHRSFGYDMTINVFAKPIKRTAKGLLCRELVGELTHGAFSPGGTGRATAGQAFDEKAKPFLMMKKTSNRYGTPYTYWTGAGETWSLEDEGRSYYENHCD